MRVALGDLWHNEHRRVYRLRASPGTDMTDSQQQRGWFRLAFAAVAFAMLVMLVPNNHSGSARSSAYNNLLPASTPVSVTARLTSWEWANLTHGSSRDRALWSAILPVLFIGLMAPLALLFVSAASAGLSASAPRLFSLFQRPPPAQTL